MQAALKETLLKHACEPYRRTGVFNFRWARGKLGGDPIFPALLGGRLLPSKARITDLGCGRGLLAAWFLGAEQLARQGRWPDAATPVQGLNFRGVDLNARDVACGTQALDAPYGARVQLRQGDMREADLAGSDVVTLLDVLHYVPFDDQERLLDRIRAALPAGGLLITRVGDALGGLRFRISQVVDQLSIVMQGHAPCRMWTRPMRDWIDLLEHRGFLVETRPMNMDTPFANVMLVGRLH